MLGDSRSDDTMLKLGKPGPFRGEAASPSNGWPDAPFCTEESPHRPPTEVSVSAGSWSSCAMATGIIEKNIRCRYMVRSGKSLRKRNK